MSRLRFNKIATPGTPAASKGELYYSSTLSPAAPAFIDEAGKVGRVAPAYAFGATAAVAGLGATAFASETYMAGTLINIGTIGSWKAGWVYEAVFDMTKTGAGTAAIVIIIRMGTLGTTSDTAILTLTGPAQTGAADTGVFTVHAQFRSVGSSTSAVIAGGWGVEHNLSATGFLSNAQVATNVGASSGFDSTTSNIIGCSFNGGASFVGTNIFSRATLIG